ncbi:MAG: major facilitator superfamily domain-containing protein [Lentinula lateritia]|nr:MAG: major facilitator superfamily domain-containing protein [Lentinula lateritia]
MASKGEPEQQLRSQNVEEELEQKNDMPLWQTILVITSCSFAMLTTTASNSAVSIALPTMEDDLEIPQAALDWVVAANPLSNGCLLLLFGRLADLYGRKKVFLLGSFWLVAFTLGCSFAQDALTLDILRGFQGLGSAATIPASLGILAHTFPPGKARAIAFATFAAGAPLGGGTGIVLGGLLTQLTPQSWRSPFYLVSGLTVLSMITAMISFNPDHPSTEEDQRVDWIGAFLVTTGLVLIVFVLGQGEVAPKQWSTPYIIALLIVGVIFVLLFLIWQYHLERVQNTTNSNPYPISNFYVASLSLFALHHLPTPPPIMKMSLWTRARGRVAVVFCIACLNWCCFQGWNYWAILYYQNYVGYSPLRTTVRMVPMFVTGLLCNGFVALFVDHIPMTILVAAGTALTGCSALLFAVIDPNAVYWAFGFPSAIIAVIGADFVFACGTMYVAKKCLPHEQSVGGAVFQTMTQLGTALGVTVSTVVFDRVLESRAADNGIDVSDIGSSGPRWLTLPAYKAAMWSCFAFGMCACLLTVIFLRVGIIGHRVRPSRSPTLTEEVEGQKTVTNSARQSAEK